MKVRSLDEDRASPAPAIVASSGIFAGAKHWRSLQAW
jgi:hypothetical protein